MTDKNTTALTQSTTLMNIPDTVTVSETDKSNFDLTIPDTVEISGQNVDGWVIVAVLIAVVLIAAIRAYVSISNRQKTERVEIVKITRTVRE